MKIVHFADLHLDAPFAWAGASGAVARRRRQALRDVLIHIVDLTRQVRAEALFCGGDLFEHEHCTPDTTEFLRKTFAELSPVPVYLAPGNHDWYGPHSPYALVEWSHNVYVFRESRLRPVELADGVTLWGAAHCAPTNTGNLLDNFHTEGVGVHLALFHGSERSWLMEQSSGKQPHAPFDTQEIGHAGIHHAFLGHYHRPKDGERHTYPGNPDPLEFGEDGERGAVIATIDNDGSISRQRQRVAKSEVHDIELDVSGCTSQEEARRRLAELAAGLGGCRAYHRHRRARRRHRLETQRPAGGNRQLRRRCRCASMISAPATMSKPFVASPPYAVSLSLTYSRLPCRRMRRAAS